MDLDPFHKESLLVSLDLLEPVGYNLSSDHLDQLVLMDFLLDLLVYNLVHTESVVGLDELGEQSYLGHLDRLYTVHLVYLVPMDHVGI